MGSTQNWKDGPVGAAASTPAAATRSYNKKLQQEQQMHCGGPDIDFVLQKLKKKKLNVM